MFVVSLQNFRDNHPFFIYTFITNEKSSVIFLFYIFIDIVIPFQRLEVEIILLH